VKCYKGKLIVYQRTRKMTIYTFKERKAQNQIDQFFEKFESNPVYSHDLNLILAALQEFCRRGIDERRFRRQGEGAVDALAAGASNLRLYCAPYGSDAIIIGNGDYKTTRLVQNCPNCKPHWEFMMELDREIQARIRNKDMYWETYINEQGIEQRKLSGDLYFELGDCD